MSWRAFGAELEQSVARAYVVEFDRFVGAGRRDDVVDRVPREHVDHRRVALVFARVVVARLQSAKSWRRWRRLEESQRATNERRRLLVVEAVDEEGAVVARAREARAVDVPVDLRHFGAARQRRQADAARLILMLI